MNAPLDQFIALQAINVSNETISGFQNSEKAKKRCQLSKALLVVVGSYAY